MKIHISTGNMKLGGVPNISLPPGQACARDVPCFKSKLCYAAKAFRQYPGTRKAWTENYKIWKKNPHGYFLQVQEWLAKHKPARFRWHVAGDFPDQWYVQGVVATAYEFPGTQFLAYTKRHDLKCEFDKTPVNLTIIRSMWPGWGTTTGWNGPVAWMQNGEEPRVPKTSLVCPGKCKPCGYQCWGLRGRDVVFNQH